MIKTRIIASIILTLLNAMIVLAETPDSLLSHQLGEVEILATAKEAPGLRRQPQSVATMEGTEMHDRQITSLKEATAVVPNLFIPNYGSRLTSAIYIRGIGSRAGTPAVGLYVDGIPYVDKSAFDFRFVDIEGMNVLRGPQGTLYGSNTMGGLVQLHTKNPFNHQGTDIRGSVATASWERNLSLTHYHSFSEKFAMSAAAYAEGTNGFYKNKLTGQRIDDRQNMGARLRGIYRPTNRLQFDASVAYDFTNEGAYPYFYEGTLGLTDQTAEPYPNLVGKITNNHENTYRRSMLSSGLNISYHAPHWEMSAVTGFQHLDDCMSIDQDFMAPDIYTLKQKQNINTLTEEVSFRNTHHQRWKRITGASLMYQHTNTDGPVNFMEEGVSGLIEGNTNSVFSRLKQQFPNMPTMAMTLQNRQFEVSSLMHSPQVSAALFHQSTVKLGNWELGAGLRLEYNDRRLSYCSGTDLTYDFAIQMSPAMKMEYPDLKASPLRQGKLHNHDLMVLPKGSVQYNLPRYLGNVYASVSKGYRSGGYNIQMFSDIIQADLRSAMMQGINEVSHGMMAHFVDMDAMTALADAAKTITYKPEYSWNYELGTHLNLIGNSMHIDAALFYSKIYDQQIARFANSGLGRMMVNAGRSHSYGAEFSLQYKPIDNLTLSANYGYTHATFKKYNENEDEDQNQNQDGNYAGNFVPFVPMHTMMADAAYTWQVGKHHLTWGVSTNGAGRIYWTEKNNAQQHFYALLGSRLKLDIRQFSFTLWGKNLTQSRHNTFYFESASRRFVQHGSPLQVGFDFALHL